MRQGEWIDPDAGKVSLKEYAGRWISERDLGDRSQELYVGYLQNHISPYLGEKMLIEISAPRIRAWCEDLLDAKTGASTVAKCYRSLRTVLNTAVDDELIRKNPGRIKGAGQESAGERPTATLEEVFAIAGSIQPRYRLLVLLPAFAQLRFGELVGLRRSDLTLPKRRKTTAEEIADGADPSGLIDAARRRSAWTVRSLSPTTASRWSRDPSRRPGVAPWRCRPRSCRTFGSTWPRAGSPTLNRTDGCSGG